jgi:hypothetical protein
MVILYHLGNNLAIKIGKKKKKDQVTEMNKIIILKTKSNLVNQNENSQT